MAITYTYDPVWVNRDNLPDSSDSKIVRAVDFETEWLAIQAAFALAATSSTPSFSGSASFSGALVANGGVIATTIGTTGDVTLGGGTTLTAPNIVATVECDATLLTAQSAAIGSGGMTVLGTVTGPDATNWNTAYGWGNHASAGYLTSFTEADPTVPSHVKGITTTNISNWNTAHGWGNHASAGYLSGNQSITLSGDLAGSGTTSINAQINANVVGANELNVVGNGTTSQYLRSDGDGTFSWATPPTSITYSAGNGISLSGTTFTVGAGNGLTQTSTGLVMSGSFTGNFTATGNVTAYSDARLKSDVQTLDGSKVYEMRGVSYIKDGKQSSGVIAQELQKVAPELVHEGEEYLSVAYGNLVGYLIEAVKELKAEVEALRGDK